MAVAVFAACLSGCSASVEGTPTRAAGQAGLFDPCAAVPDEALRAAGVDPADESKDVEGVQQPGWETCSWDGGDFYLTAFSTDHTIDEFWLKPDVRDIENFTLNGRDAFTFRSGLANESLTCGVVLAVPQGIVMMTVLVDYGLDYDIDACASVRSRAPFIEPYLPR
ncbi:DUF3558 domain-containing protein [Rhodococcus sp. IEGM 1379]|uniref:DUF3558 domain-containing protein n=1 Tax=Rhodococcus sp. IEGM 1379 TaxID=3047086 RepID=UPI0024B84FBA|nr:DUF3558 domain-containing protein [Rhodococcus sp. IEGM 1379]MDI9917010.1 DUF3558 domain-containing protein [Rhodococcus sp. IEGM 1379]